MKRIYVDVDDVVSKTTASYVRIVKEEFNRDVAFEDLTTFDLRVSFNLTENQFRYFFDLVHEHELLAGYDPVDGAVETLKEWKAQGHGIDIVTGRPTSAREVTLDWLSRHRVPFDNFIMVDKYSRPGNDLSIAITKAQLAERTYDLAVEDSAEMALFLAQDMGVKTALISCPWNWNCPGHDRIFRCDSWSDVARLV